MLNRHSNPESTFYRGTASLASETYSIVPNELYEVRRTAPAAVRAQFQRHATADGDSDQVLVPVEPLPSYVRRTVIDERFRLTLPPEPAKRPRLSKVEVCEMLDVSPEELGVLVASFGLPSPMHTRTYRPGQDDPEIAEFWNPDHVERWREKQGAVRNVFLGAHRG